MASFEAHRRQTLRRLSDAYAAGHVTVGTLEHRIETTLAAGTAGDLDGATWDLPCPGGSVRETIQSLLAGRGAPLACRCIVFRVAVPVTVTFDQEPRTWLIGRSRECDVVLRDPLVSRRHALLSTRGGVCTVRDLESTNGLLLNGERVATAALQPGDEIAFAGAVVAAVR